jgi:anthranilate/para-aminobenzoate synthase component I
MDQLERSWPGETETLARSVQRTGGETVLFQAGPGFDDGWTTRLAVEPATVLSLPRNRTDPLAPVRELEALLRNRRAHGGTGCTGLAVLAGYELLQGPVAARPGPALPDLHAWAVDDSFTRGGVDRWLLTSRFGRVEELERRIPVGEESAGNVSPTRVAAIRATTSLPRERYLRSVDRIRDHILNGDIYQANLTQQFQVPFTGDRLALYRSLTRRTPSPRSALVGCHRFAVASVSPELFLAGTRAGEIRTGPIKGTRPRHPDPVADRAAAEELRRSEKDNAELLMIVDLARNDLGRICLPGSIEVRELASLVSYPAVHHLVATVAGRLDPSAALPEILEAAFPGGSITGAPKKRAMEILRELEPVERSFYTGSLFWFGDDGTFDSSILIRSVVLADGLAQLGAGGGIVADSDAESEWTESNDKARAPAEVLGFVPEEAG